MVADRPPIGARRCVRRVARPEAISRTPVNGTWALVRRPALDHLIALRRPRRSHIYVAIGLGRRNACQDYQACYSSESFRTHCRSPKGLGVNGDAAAPFQRPFGISSHRGFGKLPDGSIPFGPVVPGATTPGATSSESKMRKSRRRRVGNPAALASRASHMLPNQEIWEAAEP
jgi:hypothetical protein